MRDAYDKVNAIILSNAITLNERYDSTAWDMSKSINLILINPCCKYTNNYGLKVLSEFFPHKTCEFEKECNKYLQQAVPDCLGNGYLPEFFAKHEFTLNLKGRGIQ